MSLRERVRSGRCVTLTGAALILVASLMSDLAHGADCFAVDNDGTYDQDGAVDGVITVTAASPSAVPAAATPYDCTGLDFVIGSGGALTFQGDVTTGDVVAILVDTLQIDPGGAIRADAEGCPGVLSGGTTSGAGSGPDAGNVCTKGIASAGGGGNDGGGAGGGAHGGAGANGAVGAGGIPHGSATAPLRFGASGGNTPGSGGGAGGTGGGVISITAQSVTHDGVLSANASGGGGGGGRVAGGGAGGSILVSTGSFSGTSGTFEARGGDAPGSAGGGGGGRVVVLYDTSSFDFDAGDFEVGGGSGGTPGDNGTVYVRDATTSSVRIFHGFTFADVDHQESSWVSDESALNQYCDPALTIDASPGITAGSIDIGGEIDCTPEIDSFSIVQAGPGSELTLADGASIRANGRLRLESPLGLSVGSGVRIANTRRAANLEIVIPAGDDQTWDGVTVTGAAEGRIVLDAALALALTNATSIEGSVLFESLSSLAIDATSVIDASEKGCDTSRFTSGKGTGPDSDNLCTQGGAGAGSAGNDFGGAGGGGHGGAGADGNVGAGGTPYDVAMAPVRFGASGGNTPGSGGGSGGAGGGAIQVIAETITHDGVIRVNGGTGGGSGGRVAGGGSGGSIFLSAQTLNVASGTFEARGGDGPGTAGGGGGGRIALVYAAGIFDADAGDFDVAGGVGVLQGDTGTVYVEDSTASAVAVFHGFTFEDIDYQFSSWVSDPAAANLYCAPGLPTSATPSLTADTLVLGGTISCLSEIASFDVVQTGSIGTLVLDSDSAIEVNGALRIEATDLEVAQGVSLANTKPGSDLTVDILDGDDQSWTGVVIDGAREGRIVLDAAVDLSLTNGTIVAGNPVWPALKSLTIDATSVIDADDKGCDSRFASLGSGAGAAPDCSNVCARGGKGSGAAGNDFGGSGGGGHGGAGGAGGVGAGGSAYETRKAPRLFGASGGNTGAASGGGGPGGGVIEIHVDGVVSNDGVVSARGGVGAGTGGRVTGGGAGGSISISADEYTCVSGGSFNASGGDGAVGTTGGGGGGRVAIIAETDSCATAPLDALDAAAVAPGGAGGGVGAATDGAVGTVFTVTSPALCGDPVAPLGASRGRSGGRSVTASDALFTLNVAVGSDCCDLCLCDINGSGDITATDALAGLNAAVGQPVILLCPSCF